MRLIWGLGRLASWRAAGLELGCNLLPFDPQRPLDAFARGKISGAILTASQAGSRGCRVGLERFPGWVVLLEDGGSEEEDFSWLGERLRGWLRTVPRDDRDLFWSPVCDWPRQMAPSPPLEQWRCDVVHVGSYRSSYTPLFARLQEEGIFFRLLGNSEPLLFPQAQGTITPQDLREIYPSSILALDLEGSPEKCLTIWASGGIPLSTLAPQPFLPVNHPLLWTPRLSLDQGIETAVKQVRTWLTTSSTLPVAEIQRTVLTQYTCVSQLERMIAWLG